MLLLHPNAKINLGLLIKGKRSDGYHLLETVFLPVPALHDDLQMSESASLGLQITGMDLIGDWQDNLCIKAYQLLKNEYPHLPNVQIHLHKRIPAGAGLGGGSSDAASTLLGLKTLFDLPIPLEALSNLAASLGADVPFFLYNSPMLAQGIGTDLQPFAQD